MLAQWEYDAHLPEDFFGDMPGRREHFMVPMRDGTRLATEVFRPDGNDKRPTILIRTAYGRLGTARYAATWLTKGCAVVCQDPRGDGASEGGQATAADNGFAHEIPDTFDTIDWITRRPWSNGRVAQWWMLLPFVPPILIGGCCCRTA